MTEREQEKWSSRSKSSGRVKVLLVSSAREDAGDLEDADVLGTGAEGDQVEVGQPEDQAVRVYLGGVLIPSPLAVIGDLQDAALADGGIDGGDEGAVVLVVGLSRGQDQEQPLQVAEVPQGLVGQAVLDAVEEFVEGFADGGAGQAGP